MVVPEALDSHPPLDSHPWLSLQTLGALGCRLEFAYGFYLDFVVCEKRLIAGSRRRWAHRHCKRKGRRAPHHLCETALALEVPTLFLHPPA